MAYDVACVDMANTTFQLLTCSNTIAGGAFFGGVYLILYIVIVMSLQSRNPLPESFLAAGVVLSLLTLVMWGLGASSVSWFVGSILATVVAVIATWKDKTP